MSHAGLSTAHLSSQLAPLAAGLPVHPQLRAALFRFPKLTHKKKETLTLANKGSMKTVLSFLKDDDLKDIETSPKLFIAVNVHLKLLAEAVI